MPELPDAPFSWFDPLLTDEAWPHLALILRVFLLLGFGFLLFRFSWRLRAERQTALPGAWPRVMTGFLLLFLVAIAWRQAHWQLFGRRNENFVAFMQRYDRREFNPAHRVRPGRILDRKGRILVVSGMTERGVQRVYRYGPVFSHALGYNHPVYGLTGLEAAARSVLLGGGLRSREDLIAMGAELMDRERHAEGPSLTTTLDVDLQVSAYELLEGRRGAVVVLDIRNGDVLAMVSRPEFDPNRLHPRLFAGQVPDAPLLNRALSGRYPPGSVYKVLIAATALQDGFSGTLDTPPDGFTTSPANPRIRDHQYYTAEREGRVWRGHGQLGLGEALAKSSNVFFAQLGVRSDWDAHVRTADAAGLLQPIALWERPEATLAVQPARLPQLSNQAPYGIAQYSIGQGDLLVSPMHMAMVAAAVARGGQSVYPRLDPKMPLRTGGWICSAENAETLKWMMFRVVREGTGRGIDLAEIPVAGKTGTAQTGAGRESHSWFMGFAPVSEPRWAFAVLVEQGGYGSQTALPIARDLLREGVREGWLKP